MHWKLLHTAPLSGADNMAVDEALMERARQTGQAVFRVYTWAQPTLSLGRNQTAAGIYSPARARDHGIAIVRRLTGGRALLHHHEVTYSVTAPLATDLSLRESYARINRLLVAGLRRLGVAVEIAAPQQRAVGPTAAPCFERPATGELVIDGKKLAGSAQWRDDGVLLQHGSILIHDDQPLVSALAETKIPHPLPAATLTSSLGRIPAVDEVAVALFDAVRSVECPRAEEIDLDSAVNGGRQRALARYLDDRWTWRR